MYTNFNGKTEIKYVVEYINDEDTWKKYCYASNHCLGEWTDYCTVREFDNSAEALTFYMVNLIDFGYKYCIKMWQEIYVDNELVFEEDIEPKGSMIALMRERIDRDMKNDIKKLKNENEELQKKNKLLNRFINSLGMSNKFDKYVKERN